MKRLVMIYHSQSGRTEDIANSIIRGIGSEDLGIDFESCRALEAGCEQILRADGVIFGTPANFGYMSGILKDFFDRCFYGLEGKVDAMPYSIFVGASTDSVGAIESVRKICSGLRLKEVQEPLIIMRHVKEKEHKLCRDFGLAMAMGLETGIF